MSSEPPAWVFLRSASQLEKLLNLGTRFEFSKAMQVWPYFQILTFTLSLFFCSVSVHAAVNCRTIFADVPLMSLQNEGISDPKKLLMFERALGRKLNRFEISVLLDIIHLPLEPLATSEVFNKENDHRYQIKYVLAQSILPEPIFHQLFMNGVLSSKWHAPSPTELRQIQEMRIRFGLSESDVKLLNQYSADMYYDVNRFEVPQSIRTRLSIALSKLPTFAGTVYLGISLRHAEGFSVGSIVEAEAIWSASKNKKTADKWVENGVTLVIYTSAGRVMGPLARYPSESEVMIPPGSKFEVQSVEGRVIYLSELN